MARDSNGNYSLPASYNPVVSGTVVDPNWANITLDDIANSLTDSLSRSNHGGMLAPLFFYDGTVLAPGISWIAENTSGFYRAATNDFRYAVGGKDLLKIATTGFTSSIAPDISFSTSNNIARFTGSGAKYSIVESLSAPVNERNAVVYKAPDGYAFFGVMKDDLSSTTKGIQMVAGDTRVFDAATGRPFTIDRADGGYLPSTGGALSGDLSINKSNPLIQLYYTPGGAVNLRTARVQLTSDGTLYWGRLNDAGAFSGGLALYASDNQCHDIGTGQRILNAGDVASLTVSNSDMVDGYNATINNWGNWCVVRDANGIINVTSLNISGLTWSNNGNWLYSGSPIWTAGAIKCNDISMNGLGVVNSAGWWYFYNPIRSTGEVHGTNIVADGGFHMGGFIRDQGHCTLAMGGNRGCMAWENNKLIYNVDNALYKEFQTYNYSDSRLKSNVKPSKVDALETLNGLDIIQYTIKPALAKLIGVDEEHRIGLNADQISQVIPEAVSIASEVGLEPSSIRPENLKMLSYAELVPWIIRALQQLSAKVA